VRRIRRTVLPMRAAGYLRRRQTRVDSGQKARTAWDDARRTKTMRGVLNVLLAMCGRRHRCMFCEDSRGTQIDHFWPLSPHPEKTFLWENMLLLCDGCNRMKGDRFDLDADGHPLLIDPTVEDPWDFLYFDPHTGMIVGRVDPFTGAVSPKGEHTTDLAVLPLNIDPVTDGRRQIARSLRRAVQRFLDRADAHSVHAAEELLAELQDHDDYGLVEWYFRRDGGDDPPFSILRASHPEVWGRIAKELSTHS